MNSRDWRHRRLAPAPLTYALRLNKGFTITLYVY